MIQPNVFYCECKELPVSEIVKNCQKHEVKLIMLDIVVNFGFQFQFPLF